jgi:hypothetical protein
LHGLNHNPTVMNRASPLPVDSINRSARGRRLRCSSHLGYALPTLTMSRAQTASKM